MDRFWKKVVKRADDRCWSWSGDNGKEGYGTIKINIGAHRVSWKIHNGEIPKGLEVCHKCDNPECTNPKHLFLGTHQQNMDDMMKKKRHRSSKGEKNGAARLTEKQALAIIKDRNAGMSIGKLAKKYATPRPTIAHITTGRHWKHLGLVRKPHNPSDYRGNKNGNAVANEQIVKEIRKLYRAGNTSHSKLAKLFNLGDMTVAHIIRRDTWKHVT